MVSSRKCLICNKRGKAETIQNRSFILCAEHNILVELDTIEQLINETKAYQDALNAEFNQFIESCENFRDTV